MSEMNQKQKQLAEEFLQEGKETYLQNRIPEAIRLLLKAKSIADSENNLKICAESANTLGVIYGAIGSLNISMDYYLEALRYAEECKYGRIMELSRNNIGSKYMDLGQYDKAVRIFRVCEKVMMEYGYLDMEKEIPMVTITYLNLIDSYCAINDYRKANEYIEKITPYIENDPEQVFTFAFDITICRMKWKIGEKEYVNQLLPKLLEMATIHTNSSNYEQNMSDLCELLQWMGEYEKWQQVLINMEKYISCLDSIYLQNFTIKMWLKYYKETNQSEKYLEKCVAFIEMYQKTSESESLEKVAIIDTKLEIYNIVTEHKKTEQKFQLDALTSVGNRLKFEKDFFTMTQALEKMHANLGIAIIDIDYFKCVNDTYGHLRGDEYLVRIANVLSSTVAEKGNVYRVGGDEFVLLIPNAQKELLGEIATKLKAELHELSIPNINSQVLPEITLSQGYICKTAYKGMNRKAVLEEVDNVLYKVKKAGRNQYLVE